VTNRVWREFDERPGFGDREMQDQLAALQRRSAGIVSNCSVEEDRVHGITCGRISLS
jgi:hypothetical protein